VPGMPVMIGARGAMINVLAAPGRKRPVAGPLSTNP